MFCRGYEVESWSRFWTRFWILSLVKMLMFDWNFEVDAWSRFWRWNLIKICVWVRDMTSRSYFGKMNSILGSVVPLAMFHYCPLLSFFFFYIAVRCHLSCVFFLIVLFCLFFYYHLVQGVARGRTARPVQQDGGSEDSEEASHMRSYDIII